LPAYESTEEYLNSTQIGRQIIRIRENVSDALTAIGAKGVTVPSGATSDDLADLIAQISGGGGSGYTRTTVCPEQTVVSTSPPEDDTDMLLLTSTDDLVEGDYYLVTVNGTERVQTAVRNNYVLYLADITDAWWDGNRMVIMASGDLYFCPWSAGSYTVKIEHLELSGSGGGGESATLITKTITANGTYDAEDDNADGYSSVTVNVPTPASVDKNVQTVQSTSRRNNTALGSITSLTCEVAGTYYVYWTCARSNTSQTWGSQLYINGTAYGTENTTWNNHVQNNHLTGVTIPANATVAVYGRSRSGYYIYVPQLTIEQTA
jgi:hypothetical protein